jgi:nitric oxide reductase subunit B
LAFGLYFLALFNLMFGWAHHAYPVPSALWIREFAYFVSMTELLILGKIIWDWRGTLTAYLKYQHRHAYRFMFAADFWIFINLVLALVISIPAVNLITHGTHVTVAHAMGATIGINTMILLSSVCYMIEEAYGESLTNRYITSVNAGIWISNLSLLVFWLALLMAGFVKGTYKGSSFPEMMSKIEPYLIAFIIAGFGLLVGFCIVLGPALYRIAGLVFKKEPTSDAAGIVSTKSTRP